ncbi:porin [Neisseriaceae bacterium TC5R-5]|nr:porin [Neisseriaceae bacterium TC5R-5]
MKKSLIALVVAALPAAAMADVTVYGTIKGGIEQVENKPSVGEKQNKTNIDDLGSFIGFKGSEDLGNGLKAIWQVESGFNIDGTDRTDTQDFNGQSGSLANRESFIGLKSDYGTLRLGQIANYGKSDMDDVVDLWEASSRALKLDVFTRDNAFVKNAVRYDSPEFEGFKASFLYGTKENKSLSSQDRETYNLGLSYRHDIGLFGKYQYTRESPVAVSAVANSEANRKHRVEFGYDANNIYVAVGYRNDKGDAGVTAQSYFNNGAAFTAANLAQGGVTGASKFESQEWALTAGYQIGAFMPKISYAQAKDLKIDGQKLPDSDYKQFIVGVDYNLSKRTVIGAQYGQIKTDGDLLYTGEGSPFAEKINAFGLNVVHKF